MSDYRPHSLILTTHLVVFHHSPRTTSAVASAALFHTRGDHGGSEDLAADWLTTVVVSAVIYFVHGVAEHALLVGVVVVFYLAN